MAASGAGDYKLEWRLWRLSNKHDDVPKASSDNVHHVAVHEGDRETSGSVKLWKYTIRGNGRSKQVGDALEGSDVLELHKSIKIILQVTPKGEGSSTKIAKEYAKLNKTDSSPHKYLSFIVSFKILMPIFSRNKRQEKGLYMHGTLSNLASLFSSDLDCL
ncbi:hypothetical protein D8674_036987 [Pyrus ussuriensis x Pyrus communis]|uniref:Bet v I/Major latex protein domain-containing protein n=1 Tax=Pyrus ussuriensis x Pyrus communis TaxID=2448454 RepID=A0A5N5GY14_9ROSA|nr:hypothetical protein D8674_036987 [Pyrus ussuriensis x Pyrus communis]